MLRDLVHFSPAPPLRFSTASHPTTRFKRTEARLVTRRAGWIWLCIFQIPQGYAEQRESGRARARRTSPGDGAPPVHYHKEPSTRRWLRAILKGGRSHELDSVLGRRGGHHCRRAEDDGRLLGRGLVQSVPDPQAWSIRVGSGRGGRTLVERQQPPGSSEGNHRGETGGVRVAPQGTPGPEGVGGPDVGRHGGRPAARPVPEHVENGPPAPWGSSTGRRGTGAARAPGFF